MVKQLTMAELGRRMKLWEKDQAGLGVLKFRNKDTDEIWINFGTCSSLVISSPFYEFRLEQAAPVLKNCPCCDGDAQYRIGVSDVDVACTECGLHTMIYETSAEAANDWNRRPSIKANVRRPGTRRCRS